MNAAPQPHVDRQPWPGKQGGKRVTRVEMAKRVRDGMRDPNIQAIAGNVLRDRGAPTSTRARVECLRDYVRESTLYAPDPPMTEMIKAAKHTLCAGNALCIPIGDCDDLTVALGALIGAAGIDVRILQIEYGGSAQSHVLLEFGDEDIGKWLTVDPSPPYPPIGYRPACEEILVCEPHNPEHVAEGSTREGMFIGVGRADGRIGSGAAPATTPATASEAIAYQNVPLPAVAHTGLRYRVGMQLAFDYDPTDNYRTRVEVGSAFQGKGWSVESMQPDGPAQFVPGVNQYIQRWILQGIAGQEIPLENDTTVIYMVLGVQSTTATPGAPSAPLAVSSPTSAVPTNVSFGQVAAVAVGVGAAGGIAYLLYKGWRLRQYA